MKILHLLSQRPDFTGSGIYLQNIIRMAEKKGHRNYLIAGVPFDSQVVPLDVSTDACRFVTFSGGDLSYPVPGMSDVMPYQSSRFRDLTPAEIEEYENAFSGRIKEALEKWHPDIIHSHHLWLMSAIARNIAPHLPLVTTCHSTDLRQFINCPHLRDRVGQPCRQIDRIMALSRQQSADITELYDIPSGQITVTGGGFTADLFSPGKKPASPPVQIIYAGKLSRAKGVPWLLRALERIAHLPVHLHLVGQGTGKEDAECRMLADKLKCGVTLYGRVSQDVLAHLMGKSHLFVLPSFFEGLPLVLLEALASGCRVVTTDLPGCCELLQGVDSNLAQLLELPPLQDVDNPFPEDMEKLTANLAEILERKINESLVAPDVKSEMTSTITANYTWPAIFAKIEQVYHEVQSATSCR
ncbi:glycosyltransferase family 4 protein [Desulfogranum japonicum]|uniref:glycosyltransferase family 4 protein n=1 Tax=Desulfogranum japonicum TaxID=231447 RepID=UPI0004903AFF|nr:glycosyltransferase family 4 protein [Desulfogranum japonicum]